MPLDDTGARIDNMLSPGIPWNPRTQAHNTYFFTAVGKQAIIPRLHWAEGGLAQGLGSQDRRVEPCLALGNTVAQFIACEFRRQTRIYDRRVEPCLAAGNTVCACDFRECFPASVHCL